MVSLLNQEQITLDDNFLEINGWKANPIDYATYFSYVLSKDNCSHNELNHEIKVIELFTGGESNRDLENCILIDNNVFCLQRNLSNGMIIPKF
jgi:hypothetical protein